MPTEVPIIEPAEVPSLNDLIDETNEQGEEVIEVEPVVPVDPVTPLAPLGSQEKETPKEVFVLSIITVLLIFALLIFVCNMVRKKV